MTLSWDNEEIARAYDVVHEEIERDAVVYSARGVAPGMVVVTGTTGGSFTSWLVCVDDGTVAGSYHDSEEAVCAARQSWNAGQRSAGRLR